jgi:hypothetical protein
MAPDGYTIREPEAPEKRPLFRPLPPPPPFPTDALGALRPAVEAIHALTQAPLALCANSALGAVTLAAQPGNDVVLPSAPDRPRPIVGMFVTVAESGERKTTADALALRAIHRLEEDWRAEYVEARRRYQNDCEAYRSARDKALRAAKGDRGLARDSLNALGPEPTPPAPPMVLLADTTPEAIVRHLEARPWAGLFSSEAGLFTGGHALSDEARMRSGALLKALWDGEPIRRSRVGTGVTFLPGRRFSVHLMAQPVAAARLLHDATLVGLGVTSRLLVVAPETTAGTRLFKEPPASAAAALSEYNARITALASRKPRFRNGSTDALDPWPLTLAPDAARLWVAFHDHIEKLLAPDGALASIRGWGAKAAEHAGRLAAVLTLFADPEAVEVSADAMAGATELVQHYGAELLRLAEAAAVAPDLALAQRVLDWWQRRPAELHLAALYQYGPPAVRDANTARRIMAILVEHGHAIELHNVEIDGRKRREAWRRT